MGVADDVACDVAWRGPNDGDGGGEHCDDLVAWQ